MSAAWGHTCSNPCGECLRREVEELRRWKAEATAVLNKWEVVWRVLGEPGQLGEFRSEACVAEIRRLEKERITASP